MMNRKKLNYKPDELKYSGIIGTGGIGTGKFFRLNGNHTLGREESRSGHFLDVRDYCKQHIILHYVKTLLGPSFPVIPVGQVGDDEIGNQLMKEMQETGFEMDHILKTAGLSTLFSFCFSYPDGSGGNLTTDNSASANVDTALIEKVRDTLKVHGSKGIIMAAPEVPLEARYKLIETGKQFGLYCTASFTTGEMPEAIGTGIMKHLDLLAINMDEASSIVRDQSPETDKISRARQAIQILHKENRNLKVSITMGKEGSCCHDGAALNYCPAILTKPVSTAGAGDAFFSGLLCGVALGLHLFEAQQLATLVAGLSVQSPDTIHHGIDRASLFRFYSLTQPAFSDKIIKLIKNQ
jgi:ribokinase